MKSVLYLVNVQHDCFNGICQLKGRKPIYQDRKLITTREQAVLQHNDDLQFVINLHAIHNADLLRKTLPRALTAPTPLVLNRDALHDKLAAGLRISGPIKRALTAQKTANTRAAKRMKLAGTAKGKGRSDSDMEEDQVCLEPSEIPLSESGSENSDVEPGSEDSN